jgi:hypothetical protein
LKAAALGVVAIISLESAKMAKKKERAFFICPRWDEVADASRNGTSGISTPIRVHEKTLAAIKGGRLDQRCARRYWRRARHRDRCSTSMPTSWTSALPTRGDLSGAASARVALVRGGTTLAKRIWTRDLRPIPRRRINVSCLAVDRQLSISRARLDGKEWHADDVRR